MCGNQKPLRPIRLSRFTGLLLVVFSLLALVPGCTTEQGTRVAPLSLARIQPGKTTMDEVKQLLGPPDEVKERFGEATWIYDHRVTKGWVFTHITGKTVKISFSSSGVVKQVKSQTTESSEEF